MTGVVTDTENVQEVFKRLSAAALLSEGKQCQVNKNDLSTILIAYKLELNKNEVPEKNTLYNLVIHPLKSKNNLT